MSVSLKAGDNLVVYTGKAQSANDAFASIVSYLSIAYYWNNGPGLYEQVITTTQMVPYGVYSVKVTQDCVWTYGADGTPPTKVWLYGQYANRPTGSNLVPYCGPQQPVENALASIWDYFLVGYYFDNALKKWVLLYSGYMMIPNTLYAITVSQDCVWPFAAPTLGGELVSALVWWEGKDGWSPIGETNDWPAETDISTAWTVENTGSQTAIFKVKFMGLTSSGVQLSPGETGTFYLYPTTPGTGTYDYTLSILAADQVVKTYPIQVTTAAVPTEPEFAGFGIADYSKV